MHRSAVEWLRKAHKNDDFRLAQRLLENKAEEVKMAKAFMSPLSTFTLESLVASRQWSAERRLSKKKENPAKTGRVQPETESEKNEAAKA